jgi:hypothetical protein
VFLVQATARCRSVLDDLVRFALLKLLLMTFRINLASSINILPVGLPAFRFPLQLLDGDVVPISPNGDSMVIEYAFWFIMCISIGPPPRGTAW